MLRFKLWGAFWGRGTRVISHARLSTSRTPERRRSSSSQTSFWERCDISNLPNCGVGKLHDLDAEKEVTD
ncbi:MAG: hypothetical protein CMM00_09750 [Rhodopirellula sp.]|nr:hypothetical protein [Rhodopirellula sp.]